MYDTGYGHGISPTCLLMELGQKLHDVSDFSIHHVSKSTAHLTELVYEVTFANLSEKADTSSMKSSKYKAARLMSELSQSTKGQDYHALLG